MNTHRFRSLIWLVGCMGCAVLADEATDSPTRELMDSYPYQSAIVALPATSTPAPVPSLAPQVSPGFLAVQEDYRTYSALQTIFDEQDKKTDSALYLRNLNGGSQLGLLGKPSIQETVIPWSPMTTVSDVAFTPGGVDSASSKLQAHFPLVSLSW
jgi:hypothetical protein